MELVTFTGSGYDATLSTGRQVAVYRDDDANRWAFKFGMIDDPDDHVSVCISDEAFQMMQSMIKQHLSKSLIERLAVKVTTTENPGWKNVVGAETGRMSKCNKCGARYPSAPAGTLHKCGACSGGMCSPE